MTPWRQSLLWLSLTLSAGAPAAEFTQAPAASVVLQAPPLPAHFDTARSPFLRVHAGPVDTQTQIRLARYAARRLPELADQLQLPIGDTIHVTIAETEAQFRALQPGLPPSWADGTAWPSLGLIYLRSPRVRGGTAAPLERVLDHELVHILLGRAFAPNRPPQWLQEGLAQVIAGEAGPQTTERLAKGMVGGLIELESLSRGFPSDPLRAELAYAQSADLIGYLQVSYGAAVVPRLIDELAGGADIRAAMRRATGASLDDVDAAWRGRLSSGIPLTISNFSGDGLWWGLGAVALTVGGVMRRRRFKRRLREMAEQERVVDAVLEAWSQQPP